MQEFDKVVDGTLLITTQDQQILNAATTAGILVSAFATGFIYDKVGRKYTIVLARFIYIAGVLVQYYAKSILNLFDGKLLGTLVSAWDTPLGLSLSLRCRLTSCEAHA